MKNLGDMALRQRQYDALQASVASFADAWRQVAPSVRTAARERVAKRLENLSTDNRTAAGTAEFVLDSPRIYQTPLQRLAQFDVYNQQVEVAKAAYLAEQSDPAIALDNFTRANEALASALKDKSRQIDAVTEEISALKALAGGLKNTATAAK